MEIFFEVILEFLLEIYLELMFWVVPEKKAASAKYRILATVIALLVLAATVALAIWGLVLWIDGGSLMGLVPLAFAVLLSLAQIILGLIVQGKHSH